MGLDTSHGCWHGAYSAFQRWRGTLMRVAYQRDIMSMQGFGGKTPWSSLGKDPLIVLLNHSDCDGIIKAKDCAPLADRLENLSRMIPMLTTDRSRAEVSGLQHIRKKPTTLIGLNGVEVRNLGMSINFVGTYLLLDLTAKSIPLTHEWILNVC